MALAKHPEQSSARAVLQDLSRLKHEGKREVLQRFFKTGPGQYGAGDIFWGITVPQVRSIVRTHKNIPLAEIPTLLKNPVHEVRLAGLLLLVELFPKHRQDVYDMYLRHTAYINNWDLVDLSVYKIVGVYLEHTPKSILTKLAHSKSLWERRIAIIATFHFIKQGYADETLKIACILLKDREDLIQKAVGWMLREVGKRCDEKI
jgi:3-methyladenine DNA glycosylase AlkD